MLSRILNFLLCFCGVALSFYALHVEYTKAGDESYRAMCDINEHMSCSKVFTSRYGTGFGLVEPLLGKDSIFNVPNSIYGIIFYLLMIVLGIFAKWIFGIYLRVAFSVMSSAGCVYLAYVLFFILDDFCLVCFGTYIVNFSLMFLSFSDLSFYKKGLTKLKTN